MRIIGLTGGIASGKSFISEHLQQLGALIIDADELARQAVQPGSVVLSEIEKEFGADLIAKDGTLDRAKMGGIVFNSAKARQKLNEIIHPQVLKEVYRLISINRNDPDLKAIIIDAPLLIESGLNEAAEEIWVVSVDKDIQVARLMSRDKMSFEQAQNRIKSQMPLAEKLAYADHVIDNNQSRAETLRQIDRHWQKVLKKDDN